MTGKSMLLRRGARPPANCGFTLLEVLVAFTIFALVAGSLLQALSASMRNDRAAEDAARAVTLAQSQLSEAVANPVNPPGPLAGRFPGPDGGYTWRTEIVSDPGRSGVTEGVPSLHSYLVHVVVRWRRDGRRHEIDLRTLALQARD